MPEVNKTTFVTSAIWRMIESASVKGVSLFISIILARILMPEDYGIVALTSVFIQFSTMFVQSGLNTALIRQKSVDQQDYSNAFFISIIIASFCYIIFWCAAPYIARFYAEPTLKSVLRVQMLSLFFCALGIVANAICVRTFNFRILCKTNFISSLISGLVGIWLAYKGFGVWALVVHTLVRDGFSTLLLLLDIKWKPSYAVSLVKIRYLLSFSFWLLLATLLDYVGNNLFSILCGKIYSLSDIAYMNKGNQLPELFCLHIFGAITSVMLPAMSAVQEDKEQLTRITRRIVNMSSYIIFPIMAGLAVIAPRLVTFLFTEKWLPCVPILRVTCLTFGMNIFRSINMQLIYAVGDSKEGMRIEIIRFICMIVCTIFATFLTDIGVYGYVFLKAVVTIIIVLIIQWRIKKYIPYSLSEWFLDILPTLFLTMMMIFITSVSRGVIANNVLGMLFQIFIGVISYCLFSWIFRMKCFLELATLISERISRSRNKK